MSIPEDTAFSRSMRFQRREAFGARFRDGEIRHHPAGKVHIAPPEALSWQPLCGEPLEDPAPRNRFVNDVARRDAEWCPICVAALFGE